MSRGFLIFAFNNDTINYLSHANWVADRVNRFLDLPVTIVTDERSLLTVPNITHNIVLAQPEGHGERKYKMDNSVKDTWFNGNRYQAFDITPYEETIILDSDFIVSSDLLSCVFGTDNSFLTHRWVTDIVHKKSLDAFEDFGDTKFPHYWATVLYFRKDDYAKDVFDLMAMIKGNYKFYATLYKFQSTPFRNDYAVSMAQAIRRGHRIRDIPCLPWPLLTTPLDVDVMQLDDTEFELRYTRHSGDKQLPRFNRIKDMDFHCMDKLALDRIVNGDSS